MMYATIVMGFVILFVSGDLLVRGSTSLATRLRLPSLFIGLTIVAFGTSAPELAVSLHAAFIGSDDIAIGNVVGSNLANILLVLGLVALLAPIPFGQKLDQTSVYFMMAATGLFAIFCTFGQLNFLQGLVMFVLLMRFLTLSFARARTAPGLDPIAYEELEASSANSSFVLPRSFLTVFIAIGMFGLPLGAHFVVVGALEIVHSLDISDATVGLTMIAFGTSLPELATSLAAVLRNEPDVAIGNIIGSNVFNILGIMGLTAMIVPIDVPISILRVDLWLMLFVTALVLPLVLSKGAITKTIGGLFLCGYAAYILQLYIVGRSVPMSGL